MLAAACPVVFSSDDLVTARGHGPPQSKSAGPTPRTRAPAPRGQQSTTRRPSGGGSVCSLIRGTSMYIQMQRSSWHLAAQPVKTLRTPGRRQSPSRAHPCSQHRCTGALLPFNCTRLRDIAQLRPARALLQWLLPTEAAWHRCCCCRSGLSSSRQAHRGSTLIAQQFSDRADVFGNFGFATFTIF